ncbi:hypothetical protein [Microcoleus sp. OTE_8_concoct_300]
MSSASRRAMGNYLHPDRNYRSAQKPHSNYKNQPVPAFGARTLRNYFYL